MKISAEMLYAAVAQTIAEGHIFGVLSAANDAKNKTAWTETNPKTKCVFESVVANLTKLSEQG